MQDLGAFTREACHIVGDIYCICEPEPLAKLAQDTRAVERVLTAAVYPESTKNPSDPEYAVLGHIVIEARFPKRSLRFSTTAQPSEHTHELMRGRQRWVL